MLRRVSILTNVLQRVLVVPFFCCCMLSAFSPAAYVGGPTSGLPLVPPTHVCA